MQAWHVIFFSYTQHVDNFLTTITYQLTMGINKYRKALDLKIQHNPTLSSFVSLSLNCF